MPVDRKPSQRILLCFITNWNEVEKWWQFFVFSQFVSHIHLEVWTNLGINCTKRMKPQMFSLDLQGTKIGFGNIFPILIWGSSVLRKSNISTICSLICSCSCLSEQIYRIVGSTNTCYYSENQVFGGVTIRVLCSKRGCY